MNRKLLYVLLALLFLTGHAGATISGGSTGGDTTPGGSNGQIQYNNNGALGGLTSNAALANIGGAPAVKTYAALNGFGDSYMYGLGATNANLTGMFSLLARDIPVPVATNYGVSGTTANQITTSVFASYYPSNLFPSLNVIQGGENDRTTCSSATAPCGLSFQEMYMAADAWLVIPQAYRIYASNATKSGTWATVTSDIFQPTATAVVGNPATNATSGSTLTFSVPTSASNKIGITWKVVTGQTGTFTISVDGSLVTDVCSGTTTFSTAPCATNPTPLAGGTFYRQEYSVTANQTHSVVVTNTASSNMEVLSVDWLPPAGTALTNMLFHINENADATWANYAVWNTVVATVTSTLKNDGLPVYLVDVVGGTPGVNATSDISLTATSACPATTTADHPNDCGYLHMEQTLLNVASANGLMPAQTATGGKYTTQTGNFTSPWSVQYQQGITLTHNQTFNAAGGGTGLTSSNPAGIDIYRNAANNNISGLGFFQDGSSGKPWSGKFIQSQYASFTLWNCFSSFSGNGTATNAASSYTNLACFDNAGNLYVPLIDTLPTTLTAGATPAISVASGLQTITLSANATPTIGTLTAGMHIALEICQPASGGPYTWTWPAAIHGGMTIGTTASTCSIQSFDSFNGTSLVAESAGVSGIAP